MLVVGDEALARIHVDPVQLCAVRMTLGRRLRAGYVQEDLVLHNGRHC